MVGEGKKCHQKSTRHAKHVMAHGPSAADAKADGGLISFQGFSTITYPRRLVAVHTQAGCYIYIGQILFADGMNLKDGHKRPRHGSARQRHFKMLSQKKKDLFRKTKTGKDVSERWKTRKPT